MLFLFIFLPDSPLSSVSEASSKVPAKKVAWLPFVKLVLSIINIKYPFMINKQYKVNEPLQLSTFIDLYISLMVHELWIAFMSQRVFCHNFMEQSLHLEHKVCQSLRCEVTTLDAGIDLKALVPL